MLLGTVLTLTTIGFIMVFSASAVLAQQRYGDKLFFFKRQLIYGMFGIFMMFVMSKIDYRRLRSLAYPLLFISILLLVLVYTPGIGFRVGGARRWIHLGPVTFQPSEFTKLSLIIYMAYYFSKKKDTIKQFKKGLLPVLLITGLLIAFIYPQPDFGNAMFLSLLLVTFLFIAGARLTHLGILGAMTLPVAFYAVFHASYRYRRLIAFIDPWKDPRSTGFQIIQSFLSLGSGQFFGCGLGNGQQKLFFLPAPHTDFIMSVIGEELGFVGVTIIILLFMFLILRGFRIAYLAQSSFASYLALGITLMIGLQTVINLGVVMGLLPTKGIPLPFISYGGSCLLITLVGIGILLNISKRLDAREEPNRW
jgi:cell division protein FtsW